MADLLSHVLTAYVLLTVASWRVDALTPPWVVVGMAGAAIPDLVKVNIVLDSNIVEEAVGLPFTWAPLSTLGGVLFVAGAITLVFERRYWRRAYALLVAGGLTSLALDGLRVYADGSSSPWLYPLTWWRPPTPSFYVTSDPRIAVVGIVVAAVVFGLDRWIEPDSL